MHLTLHFAHFWQFLWEVWEVFLSWLPLGTQKSVSMCVSFFEVVGFRVGSKKRTQLKYTWNWVLIPNKLKPLPYPSILLHVSSSKRWWHRDRARGASSSPLMSTAWSASHLDLVSLSRLGSWTRSIIKYHETQPQIHNFLHQIFQTTSEIKSSEHY